MFLKRYDLYLLALMLLLISAFVFMQPRTEADRVVFLTEGGNITVTVEVAQTPDELRTGLMHRSSLEGGMLFVFNPPRTLSFWMKNTLIPLDMIFVSSAGEIVKIERDVPPCTTEICPSYGYVYGAYVVEVNAGFADARGISEGDRMEISVNDPI